MMRNLAAIALAIILVAGVARSGDRLAPSRAPAAAAPAIDRRGEEQTFLTFPEWFLVFSSAEYATFVRDHGADEFCFWGHIGQFWRAYGDVIRETRARHEPTNWGYHLMIVVIGVSTTVEYAARSAYETVIGRLSADTTGTRTPEDDFGARAAQEYVEFIRYRPWYEFDFRTRLERLWTETPLVGPHMVRKWERKYALSTEYLVKAAYGWLITKASDTIYDPIRDTTLVLVDHWPACDEAPPTVKELSRTTDGSVLLALPRYQGFMQPASALARCGVRFEEIAGNRTEILVSVLGPANAPAPPGTHPMARQPIITEPGRERTVLIVPVIELAPILRSLEGGGSTLEHIFDY
jgi:hypothetical protein